MDETFFVSYRKTVLKNDEILVSLLIPWTQEVLTEQHFILSVVSYCYGYSMNMCMVTSSHFVVTMTLQ